jgi:Family of unknown function (DUF5686)
LNRSDMKWRNLEERDFTPNYPTELVNEPMKRHQAFSAMVGISWQPGFRYIEFPGRKVGIGSRYPRFTLTYTKGIEGLLGSDVDYDKWRFTISDNLNLRLLGRFSYRIETGGFLNAAKVEIPDYQHFNGNQMLFAGPYMNTFQLAPYYQYATTAKHYVAAHAEHHFNGLITNKIPLIRKLNWRLVGGANTFYVNKNNNYVEVFGGVENIFKIFRVDFIQSFRAGSRGQSGIRIGFSGNFSRVSAADD